MTRLFMSKMLSTVFQITLPLEMPQRVRKPRIFIDEPGGACS